MPISNAGESLSHSAYLLDLRCLGKVHVIDGINDVLSRDHAPAEPTAVETSNGVFAALDTVKLDVDLAIVVVERKADVDDLAILLVTFVLDVILELVLPIGLSLSVNGVSKERPIYGRDSTYSF